MKMNDGAESDARRPGLGARSQVLTENAIMMHLNTKKH